MGKVLSVWSGQDLFAYIPLFINIRIIIMFPDLFKDIMTLYL